MKPLRNNLLSRWRGIIWQPLPATTPRLVGMAIQSVRIAQLVIRDLLQGQIGLRAMSMVYTTLLSLVPLLAVSFSMLKAFGVHNRIEPFLLATLAPLGDKAVEITSRILDFVSNVRVGLLGSLGLAMLIYTVIALVQKTEDAFNYIWQVSQRRTLVRRFSDYLSVLLVGPLLVFTALGLTATLTSNRLVQKLLAVDPFGLIFLSVGKLAPYFLVIAAFTFFYIFIINTRVRLLPALTGGVVAGVAWQAVGKAFTLAIARSSGNLEAVYSGFAILILFMFWLYLSWNILLMGAVVAFYVQHPEQVSPNDKAPEISGEQRWQMVLTLLRELALQSTRGLAPMTLHGLQAKVGLPEKLVNDQLDRLKVKGYVLETNGEPPAFVLSRDPSLIEVREVIGNIFRGESGYFYPGEQHCPPEVRAVLDKLEQSRRTVLGAMTLRDLVTAGLEPDQMPGDTLPERESDALIETS